MRSYIDSYSKKETQQTAHSTSMIKSPWHNKWKGIILPEKEGLTNDGGKLPKRGRLAKTKPFDPRSVGELILTPGQWSCVTCTGINIDRPTNSCQYCTCLPPRECQIKPVSTFSPSLGDAAGSADARDSSEEEDNDQEYTDAYNPTDE
jgi:hypothetical protein